MDHLVTYIWVRQWSDSQEVLTVEFPIVWCHDIFVISVRNLCIFVYQTITTFSEFLFLWFWMEISIVLHDVWREVDFFEWLTKLRKCLKYTPWNVSNKDVLYNPDDIFYILQAAIVKNIDKTLKKLLTTEWPSDIYLCLGNVKKLIAFSCMLL